MFVSATRKPMRFLSKPFDPNDLLEVVDTLIERTPPGWLGLLRRLKSGFVQLSNCSA